MVRVAKKVARTIRAFLGRRVGVPRWLLTTVLVEIAYLMIRGLVDALIDASLFEILVMSALLGVWSGPSIVYWARNRYDNVKARFEHKPLKPLDMSVWIGLREQWKKPRYFRRWAIGLIILWITYAVVKSFIS